MTINRRVVGAYREFRAAGCAALESARLARAESRLRDAGGVVECAR